MSGWGRFKCLDCDTFQRHHRPVLIVTLTNNLSGTGLVLSWPGNGELLEASKLSGPWSINAAASPVTVMPNQPQQFFRILTP